MINYHLALSSVARFPCACLHFGMRHVRPVLILADTDVVGAATNSPAIAGRLGAKCSGN